MGFFNKLVKFRVTKNPFLPENFLFEYLKDSGDPEMNVDGTVAKIYEYVVPADKALVIARLNILMVDATIEPDKFGGLAALTNGLTIEALSPSDAVLKDYCNGVPIKATSEFIALAGEGFQVDKQGAALDQLAVRWTLAKAGNEVLMTEGYKFRVTVQDNLSTITKFRMMLQGQILDATP